jgi:MATE family multidrug resistance protein
MIRTFLLVSSFAWFVRESAQFGDNQLAANHILLQFISFSAFILDAFAYIAEALVGEALGSQDMTGFDRAVRLSSELAIGFSLALAVGFSLFGEMLAGLLTQHDSITLVVGDNLTWASVYIFLSFAAFQFDGIFIGTTETAAMAKAAVISSGGYLLLSVVLTRYWGSDGLWLSFVALVVLRALALAWYYPALRRRIDQAS